MTSQIYHFHNMVLNQYTCNFIWCINQCMPLEELRVSVNRASNSSSTYRKHLILKIQTTIYLLQIFVTVLLQIVLEPLHFTLKSSFYP